MYYKKYISIHSEDRDVLKYPNSSQFEIELPEDYLNVASLRLIQWTFPANYNTFSAFNSNVTMSFKINAPYNPGENYNSNVYQQRIFEALWANYNKNYVILIEDGFYNPAQMCAELTNKFNYVVTKEISEYFILQGWTDTLAEFRANGGYDRFIIVYNNVSLKLWFGNTSDGFILTNETILASSNIENNFSCVSGRNNVPEYSNWGLPSNLGLPRINVSSVSSAEFGTNSSVANYGDIVVPRFYYGDVTPGDNGYWLLPNLDMSGSSVHWVEALYKINLMGNAYIYMEIEGQNCIDETQPYNTSKFTTTTNMTNGIVNSSFAKMAVPSTPLSQWFDRESVPYKYYYPPAERIRKLKIKLRYHDGRAVEFGVFNYSFMLEFTLAVPQIERDVKQLNGLGSRV